MNIKEMHSHIDKEVNVVARIIKDERLKTKNQDKFIKLVLEDISGTIVCYVWNNSDVHLSESVLSSSMVGTIVSITGVVGTFNSVLKLDTVVIESATTEQAKEAGFQTDEQIEDDLIARYDNLYNHVHAVIFTPWIKELLNKTIFSKTNEDIVRSCSASEKMHHTYTGGLVDHTHQVLNLAIGIADTMQKDRMIDLEVVYAAAVLHDYGKIFEYYFDCNEKIWKHTPEWRIAGHIAMGYSNVLHTSFMLSEQVMETERLNNIYHCILAHHGKRDWGSPVEPATIEAKIVFTADDASSKIDSMMTDMKSVPGGAISKTSNNWFLYNPHTEHETVEE